MGLSDLLSCRGSQPKFPVRAARYYYTLLPTPPFPPPHQSVKVLSARFLSEQRRYYYTTPTSYLELLHSYKGLLGKRQNEVGGDS